MGKDLQGERIYTGLSPKFALHPVVYIRWGCFNSNLDGKLTGRAWSDHEMDEWLHSKGTRTVRVGFVPKLP